VFVISRLDSRKLRTRLGRRTTELTGFPGRKHSRLHHPGVGYLPRARHRVFGVFNELAVETGAECISDTVIETWKPAIEKEAGVA
jgi:hypothetical protein